MTGLHVEPVPIRSMYLYKKRDQGMYVSVCTFAYTCMICMYIHMHLNIHINSHIHIQVQYMFFAHVSTSRGMCVRMLCCYMLCDFALLDLLASRLCSACSFYFGSLHVPCLVVSSTAFPFPWA